MRERGFDEVMIVNPEERAGPARGVRLMPYYDANYPEMGGYADPVGEDPYAGYGQGYVGPETYDRCDGAEPGEWGAPEYGYAQADPGAMGYPSVGYVAQEPYAAPYGYVQADPRAMGYPSVGYAAQEPYAAPYGNAAPPAAFGCAGQAPCPRCSGISDAELYGYSGEDGYAEEDERYADEPAMDGYAPDLPSRFNARFGIPGSLAGPEPEPPLEGFVKPREVGPIVRQFTPAPESPSTIPETFKPLW
jgi:hypothetical protein